MKVKTHTRSIFILLAAAGSFFAPLEARKMVEFPMNRSNSFKAYKDMESVAQLLMTPEENFQLGLAALENGEYLKAEEYFAASLPSDPRNPLFSKAHFYLAKALFGSEEFDAANEALTKYLNTSHHPEYFHEAIEMKYNIAEQFRNGAKRRFLGMKQLPKWAGASHLATDIYDEVIAAMPSSELAAKSLFSKGTYLAELGEWKRARESFLFLTRKFPTHPLALESFLAISRIYREECEAERQNPDLIALAELHLKRFKEEFPNHPKQSEIEADILAMKEYYAEGLFETGEFYERTSRKQASLLYYKMAMKNFPETKTASRCQEKLARSGF